MKGDKEHRVPLCDRALTILREMKPRTISPMLPSYSFFPAGSPADR